MHKLAERVEKAIRPRPRCRSCADRDGRCDNGELCDPTEQAREIANEVDKALSRSPAGYALTCDPNVQITAWINGCKQQWDFWAEVVSRETFSGLDKTLEEAQALVNYYEGQYDMALKMRQFISEKTVSV